LVEFEADRSLLDLIGLELDLRDLLGSHVDVATVASLKDRIRPRVLAEAVPL
jgi:predicted nucleotidyltransferase